MSSSFNFSSLEQLIVKFLKCIDSYNSTDLTISTTTTDSDTSGERARICLNLGYHTIYDLIKGSKYLEAYPSTKFLSIVDQDYIELSEEAFLDDIEAMIDTTNNRKLIRKSWSWYRRSYLDPAKQSGTPLYYIRRKDRVYLAPRPNQAIQYLTDFNKFMGDMELASDMPLLPTHYDGWGIAEAAIEWYKMEDINSIPALAIRERDTKRMMSLSSIETSFDYVRVSESHFSDKLSPSGYPYVRPVGQ